MRGINNKHDESSVGCAHIADGVVVKAKKALQSAVRLAWHLMARLQLSAWHVTGA
jgi:hypothetical protein